MGKQTSSASSLALAIAPEPSPLATTTLHTPRNPNPSLGTEGNISGNEELRINGAVKEPISLKCYRLTVGRAGRLTAQVVAHEVIIYGQICGNIRAADRIEIKKDATVVGDLTTARIFIEDGAYFKGSVEIERRKVPRANQN